MIRWDETVSFGQWLTKPKIHSRVWTEAWNETVSFGQQLTKPKFYCRDSSSFFI